jgi:hypothetical protein
MIPAQCPALKENDRSGHFAGMTTGAAINDTAWMRTACPSITSDECRRRAEEAQTLAAQTLDDWERELFQGITTQWVALAVHKKGMEEECSSRPEQ